MMTEGNFLETKLFRSILKSLPRFNLLGIYPLFTLVNGSRSHYQYISHFVLLTGVLSEIAYTK